MPRLPPVPISPQARLLARLRPGVMPSVVTFDQSHSSSSATSWARPVSVPCPISERTTRITTVSSGLITTQALTSGAASAAAALPVSNGTWKPTESPPARAAEPARNFRRETSSAIVMVLSRILCSTAARLAALGGELDRGAHAVVGAAAADVGDVGVDVRVGRLRLLGEKRRRRHHHAGLAVAALRHVEGEPGFLDRMRADRRQPLDGDDLLVGAHRAQGQRAGAGRDAVDMHRAGAALGDAAAILRAGHAELLADHPQQRRVGLGLDGVRLSVDVELGHPSSPVGRPTLLTEHASLELFWTTGSAPRKAHQFPARARNGVARWREWAIASPASP